jgi:hypothetical protein
MELGRRLFIGNTRIIYEHPKDATLIIKVIKKGANKIWKWAGQCNYNEWFIWNLSKDTIYEKILCPSVWVSENGKFLIMKRAKTPISRQQHKQVSSLLPIGVCKKDACLMRNWGIFEERLVNLDYANPDWLESMKKYKKLNCNRLFL